MAPKLTTTGIFLALCMGSLLAIAQVGCLTPEQRASVAQYSQALDEARGQVEALKAELGKYRAEMAAIKADVVAGKVPAASGLAMADKVLANIDATQERLSAAMATVGKTERSIDELKKSGAPWWAYAIPAGLTAAQLLGTFVPQLSFLVPVAGALQGRLAGAQSQLATTSSRLAVTTEIAGSLSRTLDALPPTPESPVAAAKQALLLREQQADELATKADYDELRRMAQSQQI